jgi:hypothetical protein
VRHAAAVATLVALVAPALAAADEAPTLLPGGTAVIKNTHVGCRVTSDSVTCSKPGALSATLAKAGKVHVAKGSRSLFAAGPLMRLGLDDGFMTANAPIYCHVYAAPGRTVTCSTIVPAGGRPNTYGFDMSDSSVVVFRYDAAHVRHELRTFHQG